MILLEKYNNNYGQNERLESWTQLFNNVDELIDFLQKNKKHLLGGQIDSYKLVIRDVHMSKEVINNEN